MPRFELGTSCTPSRRATRLRYIPSGQSTVDSSEFTSSPSLWRLASSLPRTGAGGGTSRNSPCSSSFDSICRIDCSPFFTVFNFWRTPAPSISSTEHRGAVVLVAVLLEPPPRAGERQALVEHQLLDSQHQLDIDATIDARSAAGGRLADLRKLRFPRPQHVRLQLHDFADFRGLEELAFGCRHFESQYKAFDSNPDARGSAVVQRFGASRRAARPSQRAAVFGPRPPDFACAALAREALVGFEPGPLFTGFRRSGARSARRAPVLARILAAAHLDANRVAEKSVRLAQPVFEKPLVRKMQLRHGVGKQHERRRRHARLRRIHHAHVALPRRHRRRLRGDLLDEPVELAGRHAGAAPQRPRDRPLRAASACARR